MFSLSLCHCSYYIDIVLAHSSYSIFFLFYFRYFFKTPSDDFGTGVVFEEVTEESKVLPLWEGKVFCVIESMDDTVI